MKMSFNTAAIRRLLTAVFSDEELEIFCYDYFPLVYEKFASVTGRLVKIQLLIDHCNRYNKFDELLSKVKGINPEQYTKFFPSIKAFPQTSESIDSSRSQIEITLRGDFPNFTPELQSVTVSALAGILNIPRNQINVLCTQAGSIILQIEMPTEAVDQLIALYEANDPIMQDLGIQRARVILPPKILIVDDDEEWHTRLKAVLRNQGYKFTTAGNYLAAIEELTSDHFDLALVNVLLRPVIKPGWLLEWTAVLGIANEVGTNVIVVTDGIRGPDGISDDEVISISKQKYGAKAVLFKRQVDLLTIRAEVKKALGSQSVQSTSQNRQSALVMKPTTSCILILAASPGDQEKLRVNVEVRTIDERLRVTEFRDRFELQSHWAVRYSDLSDLLLRYKPHIVHFSGHGSSSGKIVLQNDNGESQTVEPVSLKELFRILKFKIQCVVLNACFSKDQAEAIAQEIDCVIGMSREFDDTAAISFSAGFYRGIGYGLSIKEAFELGKNEIDLAKFPDADVPQLLAKPGVNPAEIKFF